METTLRRPRVKRDAIILRVPEDLGERLRQYCQDEELSLSQVARKALTRFLDDVAPEAAISEGE